MPSKPTPVFVFGEAMIELSGVVGNRARLGVAGDTFNTAVYLARAGIETSYVTALGDDPYSDRILAALKVENINTQAVAIIKGAVPGLYAITLDKHGERSFTYWRSNSAARSFFKSSKVDEVLAKMQSANTLYLSGITLSIFGDNDRHKVLNIIRTLRRNGGQFVFDTNYRPRGWASREQAKAAMNAVMPFVSTALLTWEDEQELFGDVSAEDCAARWHKAGVAEVIIKAGERGAYCQSTGWVPPRQKIKPIDTTGAGDSFNGAYLAARLSGADIGEAILKGHELAAKVLMTNGAIL